MFTTLIDCRSLEEFLDREDWVIVDTRFNLADKTAGHRAYLEGHIPGAVYTDLEKDLSGQAGPATGRHPVPDAARLAEVFSRLGIGPDTQVVAYDDAGGSIAARLCGSCTTWATTPPPYSTAAGRSGRPGALPRKAGKVRIVLRPHSRAGPGTHGWSRQPKCPMRRA
jgi:hypothetical protein